MNRHRWLTRGTRPYDVTVRRDATDTELADLVRAFARLDPPIFVRFTTAPDTT